MNVVLHTTAGGQSPSFTGKVRDIYDRGEHLVIVTTDRISAFDVVMRDGIPNKGKVLHGISKFWFARLQIPTHYVTDDLAEIGEPFAADPATFAGRTMLVRKLRPLPLECIVRAYLTGSAWAEYQKRVAVGDVALPPGMQQNQAFLEPIYTPSTKAGPGGHDENITLHQSVQFLGD